MSLLMTDILGIGSQETVDVPPPPGPTPFAKRIPGGCLHARI